MQLNIFIVISNVLLLQLNKVKSFNFPEGSDSPNPVENLDDNEVLVRQLVTGIATTTATTCICVPPGQCPNLPTDGSGQIDIRIVNNGGTTTTTIAPGGTCQYGLVRCCMNGPYRCGVRYNSPPGSQTPQPGQAAFGAYPWQIAILTTGEVYLGSGALIDSRHIITAAHKVNNLAINSIKVRLGEWDASSSSEPIPAQDVNVARAFIHPNFNANNLQNDIAVLRLSSTVQLGQVPTIATACLPTGSYVGQRCFVAGWGKNAFTGSYQSILRDVDVQIRSPTDCQRQLSGTRLGTNFIFNTTSFICAGGDLGKDACTGDGGSPLVCQNNNQWFVVGLVAWGIGCATGGVPGVYVNVVAYLQWIQNSINTT